MNEPESRPTPTEAARAWREQQAFDGPASPDTRSTFTLAAQMGEEREEARALADWISFNRSAAFLRALFEELQFTPSRGLFNAEGQHHE